MTDKVRRFPIVLTLFAALALTILIGLGIWQLRRLEWKEALLADIAAAQAAPYRPLAEALAEPDADFVRVEVDCPGLGTALFQEIYALHEGKMASRLVSACLIEGSTYDGILVDRGLVDETISARPPETGESIPIHVKGVLRRSDEKAKPPENGRVWFGRDLKGIAAALGLQNPAPYFLMAETSSNPEWQALRPTPLPSDIPNRHLEYALTWFGLAAALTGVYSALLFRRLGGR